MQASLETQVRLRHYITLQPEFQRPPSSSSFFQKAVCAKSTSPCAATTPLLQWRTRKFNIDILCHWAVGPARRTRQEFDKHSLLLVSRRPFFFASQSNCSSLALCERLSSHLCSKPGPVSFACRVRPSRRWTPPSSDRIWKHLPALFRQRPRMGHSAGKKPTHTDEMFIDVANDDADTRHDFPR